MINPLGLARRYENVGFLQVGGVELFINVLHKILPETLNGLSCALHKNNVAL